MVKNVNNIKTTDISDLVKKADYDSKIGETKMKKFDHDHGEYITTQKVNKLIADNLLQN